MYSLRVPSISGLFAPLLAAALLLVHLALTLAATIPQSATFDEPSHLTAGYAALQFGDHRLGPGHPPLLRMWAALPLLFTPGIKMDRTGDEWTRGRQYAIAHRFLYQDNDADQLLLRGRVMIALLGTLLGVFIFFWARALLGTVPALLCLGLYTLEPNLMAHAGLVTTDLGLTCFFTGTLFFLWLALRRLTLWNVLGLALCMALALASKYSALLLPPLTAVLLLGRALGKRPWESIIPRRAVGPISLDTRGRRLAAVGIVLFAAFLLTLAVLHGVYRVNGGSPDAEPFLSEYPTDPRTLVSPAVRGVAGFFERTRLVPRMYVEGFLVNEGVTGTRTAYALGRIREGGWWWYFPFALAVKLPLTILLLALAGFWIALRRGEWLGGDRLAVTLPLLVYLALAMASDVNIGVRHVLPVIPLLLILGAAALARLPSAWFRRIVPVVGLILLAELLLVWPHCLASFNLASGGPRNGHRLLLDSNLDWGQDLKRLKTWMDENGVKKINLSYFGSADPRYYGIDATYLPGAPSFAMRLMGPPRLPGWVAVSATNLYGLYYGEPVRALYRPMLTRPPDARVGRSILLWNVQDPWWPPRR